MIPNEEVGDKAATEKAMADVIIGMAIDFTSKMPGTVESVTINGIRVTKVYPSGPTDRIAVLCGGRRAYIEPWNIWKHRR